MFTQYLEQWSYVAVFILAAIPWIELAAIIPLSIAFGLQPIPVAIVGFAGNWLTVFLLIVLFDRFQQWRSRRRAQRGENAPEGTRQQRAKRIMEKYGLPGLAFTGPLLIGSHIAAAVAMAFGAKRGPVTLWLTISLAVWTVVIAIISYYGFDALGITSSN